MNRKSGNWAVLADLMDDYGAVAAMVQEAVRPPDTLTELRVFGDPSLRDDRWHLPVPQGTSRPFASAVALRAEMAVTCWEPQPLAEAEYGSPVISHPGQWVAIGIGEPDRQVWVVSLYGIWDTAPNGRDIFAEATLHRALSDLAFLFHTPAARRLVLGGDLNIWRGYGQKKWERGYRTVFERLRAYGIELAGPHRTTGAPLMSCPCRSGQACTHVRSYRPSHKSDSTPYQNDFMFARGVQVEECVALDEERYWQHSDHCPLLIEIVAP